MRLSQVLATLVAVSSVSASWPDALDGVKAMDMHAMLYPRQDNNQKSSDKPQSTADSKDQKSSAASTQTEKPSGSAKETESVKESGSQKPSGTKSATKSTDKNFDPRLPAGGISMITPAPTAGPQYYKIGDWVTFAWNYTSLSVTPSAIDIMATCTANQATYTLAVNQSVDATGMVFWDTGAYQSTATIPLLTETYTLMIYDANSSVSATARAGYLATQNQFTFGMYEPQPYTPWADFKCANCKSAGLSSFEQLTLNAMLITSGTTIASLLYFAYSFGVL